MIKRTGISTLRELAHRLCTALTKFTPILTQLYGDNPTLMAALAAAQTACAELQAALEPLVDYGD